MRKHTKEFKSSISTFGRELDSKITVLGTELILEKEDLFSITPITNSTLLKTVMKEVDFESKKQIGIGQEVNVKSGVKVNGEYEYIDYGNYSVYKSEYKAETDTYSHICYDKMLKTMIDYTPLDITYPINLREYINAIATKCGLEFADKNSAFANYNTSINEDHFSNGNYTFRDVLDYIAQLVGGWLCINDNDELEIRYPELAKNYDKVSGENVSFISNVEDEINTIIVDGKSTQATRSGKNLFDINKQYKVGQSFTYNGITITYNENGYITLNGTASANGDINIVPNDYTITLDKDIYLCFEALSGSVNIPSRGVSVQAINKSGDSIWKYKANANNPIMKVPYSDIASIKWIRVILTPGLSFNNYKFRFWVSTENNLDYEPYGVMPSPDYPSEIESVGTYFSFDEETGKYGIEVKNTGKNLLNIFENYTSGQSITSNGITYKINEDGTITANGTATANAVLDVGRNLTNEFKEGTYIASGCPLNGSSSTYQITLFKTSTETTTALGGDFGSGLIVSINETCYLWERIVIYKGQTVNNLVFKPMIRLSSIIDDTYEPYQSASLLFQLDQPLRSLPNGVKDELVIENGRAKIIKNVAKMIVENGNFYDGTTWNGYFVQPEGKINEANNRLLCDRAITNRTYTDGTMYDNQVNVMFVGNNTDTIETLKAKYDGATLYYQLATPTEIDLGEVDTLSTFKGVNNVSLDTNIQTNMTITYPTEYEELDKHFLKDVNVSFSKKYGAVNSVVFSRGNGSDNIYRKDNASINKNGLTEIKIADNPFLEGDDRENFIQSLFDKINGLEFYIMDVASTGIMYLELGDFYYFNMVEEKPSLKSGLVKSGMRKAQGSSGGKFLCLLMNDEIKITQGLEESIYTDEPEITETDYKTASITDTSIKNAIIQTNKNSAEILLKVNSDEVVSAINLSPENIKISSAKLDIDAIATFTNSKLAQAGSTVINGANITTGSINCDRLNGGAINGQAIRGGSISITKGEYYFTMGIDTDNPSVSGLNVGKKGIKAHSDITAKGFAITDSDIGKSESFGIYDGHGHVHYLTFTGGILTKWEYK